MPSFVTLYVSHRRMIITRSFILPNWVGYSTVSPSGITPSTTAISICTIFLPVKLPHEMDLLK